MTMLTIIALLGALALIGGIGGVYIALAERLDKLQRSNNRLWQHIRNQAQINIALRSRLHLLEHNRSGKGMPEPDLGHYNPQCEVSSHWLRRQAD